jgi:hypothetical protein
MPYPSSRWLGTCLAALLAACSTAPSPPVPVAGTASTLARLTGEWVGEYRSPDTGRSGSIVFHMVTGENHAHGDVEMVPRGGNVPLRPFAPEGLDPARMPQILSIDFVVAVGDSVSGNLTPYLDPDCRCAVSTSFVGRLQDDRISGAFRSVRADGAIANGTWEVSRSREH